MDYIADLKKGWTDSDHPIAFTGVSQIFDYYQGRLSRRQIKHTLSEISTYSKFVELKRPYHYNHFYVYRRNQQWQLDVTFLEQLGSYNSGYKWLLFCIDVFSRLLLVTPLKSKKSKIVTQKAERMIKFAGPPFGVYVDRGG